MGAITAKQFKKETDQQLKNREAEESAVRKKLWDWEEPEMTDEEEMGDNFNLGDIHETHYHTDKPKQGDTLKKAAIAAGIAAAGMGVGATGAAATGLAAWGIYNLTRPTTEIVQPTNPVVDTDTDTKYGLRIYREESTD